MASVSVVSSAEFRANLTQPQNAAPEGDEPFSMLLNSVAEVKAGVQRPEAPKATERNDVPTKQQKPETDADRQAKRRAPDADKPDAKPQTEANAPAKPADDDVEETESDDKGDDTAAVDALLMIALTDQQQTTVAVQTVGDPDVEAQVETAPVVVANVEAAAEIQAAPALAAAIAEVTSVAPTEAPPVQAAPKPTKVNVQLEISTPSGNGKINELSLPAAAAEAILSRAKPASAAANFTLEVQQQTQPGSVQVANATPLQGPAPLEMLNAAISKQIQLALGTDAASQPQDAQKPLISSNAVAPNFAMTAQVAAPVTVQAQQLTEASRAVPMDQLAVEIATRASKGERRFDIRLDPPELGRIDVRLEIDSKGNTTTKLIVERSETLDMLQRDARGLEKALQNAGLKTDAGGLQFSLSQDAQTQQGQQNHAPEMRGRLDPLQADAEVMTEVSINNATLAAQLRGGVDIRI